MAGAGVDGNVPFPDQTWEQNKHLYLLGQFNSHLEFWLRNGIGKTKNIFHSTDKDKFGEERIFETVHFPFEG